MARQLETPKFRDEAEEAQWWADNQELLLREFEQAAADGTLGRATLKKRGLVSLSTVQLDAEDSALAAAQAEARGMQFQVYVKMLVHEALLRESSLE